MISRAVHRAQRAVRLARRVVFDSYHPPCVQTLTKSGATDTHAYMQERLEPLLRMPKVSLSDSLADPDPKQLPGTTWVVTAYFNPFADSYRLLNYRLFRSALRAQGVSLLTIEHANVFGEYELNSDDAECLVRVDGGSILWQKERLINLAIEKLPKECDKVVWLDSDVVFLNPQWLEETSMLLQRYKVVQPFSLVVHLPKDASNFDPCDASTFCSNTELQTGLFFREIELKGFRNKSSRGDPQHRPWGMPGLAWAARRELLEELPLYERAIIGGGDAIFAKGVLGRIGASPFREFPTPLKTDALRYARNLEQEVAGSATYRDGTILHLWHGESISRKYRSRYRILNRHNFEPHTDVHVNNGAPLTWSSDKSSLQSSVEQYLESRSN